GKVRKYVTDFPNHKTANMESVIAFPHLGASTAEAEDNCAKMAASQVVEYIENGNLINAVNYPNISLGPKTKDHRLIVLHLHQEGIANSIIKTVEKKANIKQMVSAEKGEFAITIIDFNDVKGGCENETCLLDLLSEVEGLIRVRVIH
ncbi:MAG: 3-phosphoglycerate dehydrogenase, partial [Erysipelotrichia bacterium]|nr:3-phosphoglycerate dehydrogenase [Erysipelotrichia bacterium]